MISWAELSEYTLEKKISLLYQHAQFVVGIRYYSYKVNLYLLGKDYVEVFIKHKWTSVERIALLDRAHTRMKFYSDQIKLPTSL
jgi:hypothetical protein